MELKELSEKINKRHVKVKMPLIESGSYSMQYAKLLRTFSNEVSKSFEKMATNIFKSINTINKLSIDKQRVFDGFDDIDFFMGVKAGYKTTLSYLFDYYSGKAELLAKKYTEEELANLYRYVHGKYKSSFPNLSVSGEYYQNVMQAVVDENLILIKSIPENILKDVQVALSQSIISGNNKELIKELKRMRDVSKSRAEFIARDQIHKAVESFKLVQNKALGIDYYEWLTSEDEKVSGGLGGHKQNNRRIFKYGSNEAIISYSANRGFYYGKPGDRLNCRCIALGVVLDIDEKIVKARDGYGYEIIKKR